MRCSARNGPIPYAKSLKMRRVASGERELFIVDEMKKALEEMGGKHVLPFRFRNPAGTRTTHHLFFVSKAFRGYEIMRDVMYKHSHKDATWPSSSTTRRTRGGLACSSW